MISQADVIHSHVSGVEPIHLDKIEMFFKSVAKFNQYTIENVDQAHKLRPLYAEMVYKKEQEIGIRFNMWNPVLVEELEEAFMERYLK